MISDSKVTIENLKPGKIYWVQNIRPDKLYKWEVYLNFIVNLSSLH